MKFLAQKQGPEAMLFAAGSTPMLFAFSSRIHPHPTGLHPIIIFPVFGISKLMPCSTL